MWRMATRLDNADLKHEIWGRRSGQKKRTYIWFLRLITSKTVKRGKNSPNTAKAEFLNIFTNRQYRKFTNYEGHLYFVFVREAQALRIVSSQLRNG